MHAPTKQKSGSSKDSFYEELEQVLHHFPKYYMKIQLGDFDTKFGEKIFLNRQLGMRVYTIHQDSNNDDFRIVTFAT